MSVFYADSSVLVKRHVWEVGSEWVTLLCDPALGHEITTSQLSVIEVISALNRRRREGSIAETDYALLRDDFLSLCHSAYRLVSVTEPVLLHARLLLERYPLRAYDALHLASALEVHISLISAGLPPLTFLAADDRLLDAATVEGLPVDNPNRYP